MRPASVIFLVISVIIMAAGLGLCFFAQNKAEDEGIQLFESETADSGDTVETIDFAEEELEIGRIALTLSNCEVNVSMSDRSYVELVNFETGHYVRGTSNQTLSIDDTINVRSILGFAQNAEFKGIRQYLQYYSSSRDKAEREKKINVFINPQDNLKIFEISVKNGSVTLGDLSVKSADYKITVGSGDVTVGSISKSSSVEISVDNGNVSAAVRTVQHMLVTVGHGDFSAEVLSPDNQNYKLNAEDGSINYLGSEIPSPHEETHPIASTSIDAEVWHGDIIITALQSSAAKEVD